MTKPTVRQRESDEGFDARIGNQVFGLKFGVAALRNIRSALMQLAYGIAKDEQLTGVLVLVNVRVTPERLLEEWKFASSVLRSNVLKRLSICIAQNHCLTGIPYDLNGKAQQIIKHLIAEKKPANGLHLPRPDYPFIVFGLLIHQWLLGKGPVTTKWLMSTAGCAYPTVANVLGQLEHCLTRHSDRKIELNRFPKEEWANFVAVSDKARHTIRFADTSGQPRSLQSVLRRVQQLDRKDVAIAGVTGALHYHPGLDIIGAPRLALSVHCPGKNADLGFVERIDPSLKQTERRDFPTALVVHMVRRAIPLFQQAKGLVFADPVECALDLHEARLEPQTWQFLSSFPSMKGQL